MASHKAGLSRLFSSSSRHLANSPTQFEAHRRCTKALNTRGKPPHDQQYPIRRSAKSELRCLSARIRGNCSDGEHDHANQLPPSHILAPPLALSTAGFWGRLADSGSLAVIRAKQAAVSSLDSNALLGGRCSDRLISGALQD